MSILSDLKNSKYLKKEDCPLVLTIALAKQENIAMEGEKARICWVLYFNETEKGLVLNTTNGNILYENTGSDGGMDGKPWIGKMVQLYNEPSVFYKGKRVGGIRIRSNAHEPHIDSVNQDIQEAERLNRGEEPSDDEIPF